MTTPQEDAELRVQFVNSAPDDKEWSAHIHLLNEWTPGDAQLRHIVGYIRSGQHFPKDMHVDLIEQVFAARDEQREREIRSSELLQLELGYQIANEDGGVFSVGKHLEIRRREIATITLPTKTNGDK